MKISVIFVILTLCIVVRGWATLLQPIAMSIGVAIAALNLNADLISDLQPTVLRNLFSIVKVTEEEKGTSTVFKFFFEKKWTAFWDEMVKRDDYKEKMMEILGYDKTLEEHARDLENGDPIANEKMEKWKDK